MKVTAMRKIKSVIVILGFCLSYLFSTVAATILNDANFSKYPQTYIYPAILGLFVIGVLLYVTKLYASSYSRAGFVEMMKTVFIVLATFGFNIVASLAVEELEIFWCTDCFLVYFVTALSMVSVFRIYNFLKSYRTRGVFGDKKKVLIVGAGSAGRMIIREIQNTDKINYAAVGIVDDDRTKHGSFVSGVKVLGPCFKIKEYAEECSADLILIAIPSASALEIKRISEYCLETPCEVKILPGIYQMLDGKVSVSHLKDVEVEDLLGRDPVKINLDEVMGYIENKTVLVTGGGGSIGSELCRQIARHNPSHLIILDIYENNAYEIEQELIRFVPSLNLTTLIASIRDRTKMEAVFDKYRPEIVFHAAAHKHVPLMETSPCEAVKNNIFGTYNLVRCADKYGVRKFVQISTDKAVNPTNVMGATKRVCEMIIQAYSRCSETQFVAVRFGNVLGSNGSVIPLFKKQIVAGGPVTVTHKDIIRYFMTIPEAVSLVLQAGAYAKGGEIFVLDMGEQVRIYDLAENLIRLMGYEPHRDIEIKITGLRPGEKLYEERLMAEEGMTKTANDRISIGKPIDFDDAHLFATLEELYEKAAQESDEMKELVKALVPTYIIDKRASGIDNSSFAAESGISSNTAKHAKTTPADEPSPEVPSAAAETSQKAKTTLKV